MEKTKQFRSVKKHKNRERKIHVGFFVVVLLGFFLYFPFQWRFVSVFNETEAETQKEREQTERATDTEGEIMNLVPKKKKKPDLEAGYYGDGTPNREEIMSLI